MKPESLSLLLQEIAGMVQSRRSIPIGLRAIRDPSLGKLGVAAERLSVQIEAGQSLAAALEEVGEDQLPISRASLQTLLADGSPRPLYTLATLMQHLSESRTHAVIGWLYPAASLVVTCLVVTVLVPMLVVSISENDIVPLGLSQDFVAFCRWLPPNFWIPLIVLLVVLVGIYFVLSGGSKANRLSPVSRSNRYFGWSAYCQVLASMLDDDVPLENALPAAMEVASIASPADDALPPMLDCLVSDLDSAADREPWVTEQLLALSALYEERGYQASSLYLQWLPLLATVVLMAVTLLAMTLLLLRPIYGTFQEMV